MAYDDVDDFSSTVKIKIKTNNYNKYLPQYCCRKNGNGGYEKVTHFMFKQGHKKQDPSLTFALNLFSQLIHFI